MRNRIIFLSCLVLPFIWSCSDKSENKVQKEFNRIPNSILIIYTSGDPYKSISDIKPEEVDSYSGATPSDMNVKIISQKLFSELKNKHYNVKMVKASEVVNYKEILQYDMLIVGTPTYFWNMHWEIKKMMDINYGKIYIAQQEKFKKMKHIVFAMSEFDKCAESANEQMKSATSDCSAKLDTSIVFITKQTMQQYEEQISRFAVIAENIMNKK